MVLEDLEDDLYAEAEEQDTMAEEKDSEDDNDEPRPVGGGVVPVPGSRGVKAWTPFVAINERKRYLNKLSDEEIFDMFDEYYLGYATKGHCIRRLGGGSNKQMKCGCLSILQNRCAREAPTRKENIVFLIPFDAAGDTDGKEEEGGDIFPQELVAEHKICVHSLMTLCGLGKSVWTHIRSLASAGSIAPNHGLVGKSPNRHGVINNQEEDVHAHFQDLKSLCDVQATRFVREQTGLVTECDNDDSAVYLPQRLWGNGTGAMVVIALPVVTKLKRTMWEIPQFLKMKTLMVQGRNVHPGLCIGASGRRTIQNSRHKFSTRPPSSSLYSSEDTNIQEEDSDEEEDDTMLRASKSRQPTAASQDSGSSESKAQEAESTSSESKTQEEEAAGE
eukprot:scaffold345164_cov31-Attheya_sp.AAC.1